MNFKLLSLLIILTFASTTFSTKIKSFVGLRELTHQIEGYEICDKCYTFVEDNIHSTVNNIIHGGNKSCSDICSVLNSTSYDVCETMCETLGLELFMVLFSVVDPDPVYICELLKVCEINDNGFANVTSVTVSPTSAPQNTSFNVNVDYSVSSELGTGTIQVQVWAPGDGQVVTLNYLLEETTVGQYTQSFIIETYPNDNCNFTAGLYMVDVLICEGSCQSTHPHSKIYNLERSQFTITGNGGSGSGSSGSYLFW
ncbi:hypothetical protein PPL_10504 [Heterostelium album PN500]|uniref:Saposin B-type domain-containing protein n=1 Tax=Heterostelium pallidum (strain ATCC 26659 / Pp 5 / PN500) TaxID=670386 RepID=D3BR98_HETP5|nr:hypothetical protein PPL_10504 [Heterostelium album PN500]EFA75930.1 hypothetical protein PPL_10504 [Heterostelium album PN500]|eukprot:XP_020428064.1 hypothetical protein PPL_10504 [Heterostelium album PN500]